MPTHCELLILILVLTLNGQVHTGEIIGGQEAAPHSRPYMVILEMHREENKTSHCGGFLLNEDFVLTAAHCNAQSYTVLLGAHNVQNKSEIKRIPVKQSFPHGKYDAIHYRNDIMLLKLSSKATFDENVRPIDLADEGDSSLPKICSVSGWGRDGNSKYMSVKLMEVNVTLIESELCPGERLYCSDGERGPGGGDSGGPLVCEGGTAYGVVSTGSSKPKEIPMFTYSKIPYYRNWIDSTMKKHGTRK